MADVISPTHARRSLLPLAALVLAIGLMTLSVAATVSDHGNKRKQEDRELTFQARGQAQVLQGYFARSSSLTQLMSHNPAFRGFYELPGTRMERVRAGGKVVGQANRALAYVEALFPNSIGEACFIDDGGAENARAVKGKAAPISELSADETGNPFFHPTFALKPGQVYQAAPYVSPDTNEWVIANATPVRLPRGAGRAIVHFEVTVESFRRAAAVENRDVNLTIVDARTGRVVLDSRHPQSSQPGAPLGVPGDHSFRGLVHRQGGSGTFEVRGHPAAYEDLVTKGHNANHWIVVASSRTEATSWLSSLGPPQLAVVVCALLLFGFAILAFRSSQRVLHRAALTDPLTGLANRRKLLADLEAGSAAASEDSPMLLAIYDLDGFKSYNDSFGHPAGDALLVRLSTALGDAVKDAGEAYRMGGDEFCVLARVPPQQALPLVEAGALALAERGEGFTIAASQGWVLLPTDTDDPANGLRMADQRMYAGKSVGRASVGRQTTDVLVRVLAERHPDMAEHMDGVTALCQRMALRLGITGQDRATLLQAASLHDIGKTAIPDGVLEKPGKLTEEEWVFMRQHTVIGERILGGAPALTGAAKLVRSSHEWFDGTGYPDGLAGDEIPLGARIIGVCDAFDAMTSSRPYRPTPMSAEGARAEIRRVAGSQFDPAVAEAFEAELTASPAVPIPG